MNPEVKKLMVQGFWQGMGQMGAYAVIGGLTAAVMWALFPKPKGGCGCGCDGKDKK